jgi:hypothetical protein
MLDHCLKSFQFVSILNSVINSCIQEKRFPSFLKIAKIVPVPKVFNPKAPSDPRRISIQPVLANV